MQVKRMENMKNSKNNYNKTKYDFMLTQYNEKLPLSFLIFFILQIFQKNKAKNN